MRAISEYRVQGPHVQVAFTHTVKQRSTKKIYCFSSCASVSVLGDQCFMQQAKQLTGGVPNPRTRMTMLLGWYCRVTTTRYGSWS
jgi:hypothetical protein